MRSRQRSGSKMVMPRTSRSTTYCSPRYCRLPLSSIGQEELEINGQTVGVMGIMSATSPLNVTGLPGVSMRFGTSKEGMPIGVQIVGSWQAESTILHVASLLEQISPVSALHPNL